MAANEVQNVGYAITQLREWRSKWNYNEPIDIVRVNSHTSYVIFYRLLCNQAVKRFSVPRDNNKVKGKQDAIREFHKYRKKCGYWDKVYILDVQKHRTFDVFYSLEDKHQTRLD